MLCAEILRGVGGILLDRHGKRFANELGKRDYVTGRMIASEGLSYNPNAFIILLNGRAAAVADKHVPLYHEKGLLVKFDTLKAVAQWAGVPQETILETFNAYNKAAEKGEDEFGKKFFHNMPYTADGGPWYAGHVTPALHYTMGGIKINNQTQVLRPDGSSIPGLFAAGEVVGGVHGKNRLGGNALTECGVFGMIAGEQVNLSPKQPLTSATEAVPEAVPEAAQAAEGAGGLKKVTVSELANHDKKDDCWVNLYGKVYDFTDFLDDHPAGAEAILEYGGKDGSDIFSKVHSMSMLDDFEPIGEMV